MRWVGLAVALLLIAQSVQSQHSAQIIDGDTLKQDGITYRLHGIDAPEFGQRCGQEPCGKLAVNALVELAEGKRLECERMADDRYKRTVAICRVEGIDLGEELVRQGHAWAFLRFSNDYRAAEAVARAAGFGIWRGDAVAPWIYRRKRWETAVQEAPDGCPIKGNISQNGRIYHPPWSPWYSRTKINRSKGERWFCDESEAIEAGWRAPIWR